MGELPSDYTQTGTARRRSYQEEAALLRVILRMLSRQGAATHKRP